MKESLVYFQPNRHSQYSIDWKEVTAFQENQVISVLSHNYSLGEVFNIQQVNEYEYNSNNFLIKTDHSENPAEYLLRKNITLQDKDKIYLIEKITNHLNNEGVPVSRTIPTENGEVVCYSDGYYWQLFEFIRGNHYQGTPEQLTEAARQISLLHLALSKIQFEIKTEEKMPWDLNEWTGFFEFTRTGEKPIDKKITEERGFVLNTLAKVNGEYGNYSHILQPIHGDLHPHNTIFEGNKLTAFLDFADVRVSEQARDCANACHRFVRQYVVNQGNPWEYELSKGLAMFFKNYDMVRPLTREQLRSIPVLMQDELLRKIRVDLGHYFKTGDPSGVENGEFEKLSGLLRESYVLEKEINSI